MGQRSKRSDRCEACRMHTDQCICEHNPNVQIQSQVIVIMHHREWHRTTGTARLAKLALGDQCTIHLRGLPHETPSENILPEGYRPLLLYPSESARVLTPEMVAEDPRPVALIVPDGSWRQASKVPRRIPALAKVPHVTLADDAPTRYRLRREPKLGGLATYEAIARSLGVLDGPHVRQELETFFDLMVERTLQTRGNTHTPA